MYSSPLLSTLERQIIIALIDMGIDYQSFVIAPNGCVKADITFDYKGNCIALEVLPPPRPPNAHAREWLPPHTWRRLIQLPLPVDLLIEV